MTTDDTTRLAVLTDSDTAISSTSKDDGWSNLGEVGSYLIKSHALSQLWVRLKPTSPKAARTR